MEIPKRLIEKTLPNPFISFYGKHKISPVHQDIGNFRAHIERREKLYRSLGLPVVAFSDRRIVEIGPGGGYNALAFFSWGANVDFVEPNPKAQGELIELFATRKIGRRSWKLFPCSVEEFNPTSRYDIVIAEGFIPGLYAREKVISKLRQLVVPGGVVVVTCIDEIGFLFELIKRTVGHLLIKQKNIQGFDDKVSVLSRAFASHLKELKFATRPIQDWIADLFLNPATYGKFFTIAECVKEFGTEFELLGTSPIMFTDYSWYKDVDFNRRRSILDQYAVKRHILLWYKMKESVRSSAANNILAKEVSELRVICKSTEKNFNEDDIRRVTTQLKSIINLTRDLGPEVSERLREGIRFLEDKELTEKKISQSVKFASAFGRGQQYVSFIRKSNY